MAQVMFTFTEPEFRTLIRDTFTEVLSNVPKETPPQPTEYKTRRETSEILGISLVTLNEWTKTGIVKGLRIGNRVRYRLSDIQDALKEIQVYKRRGA